MTATWTHIRLELARQPDAPAGDPRDGWDIVAALDAGGRLDGEACRAAPERLHVRRFEDDQTVATGSLKQGPGGRWLLDLGDDGVPDATGFRFGEESFVTGEYVSLTDADGEQRTYVVAKTVAV